MRSSARASTNTRSRTKKRAIIADGRGKHFDPTSSMPSWRIFRIHGDRRSLSRRRPHARPHHTMKDSDTRRSKRSGLTGAALRIVVIYALFSGF